MSYFAGIMSGTSLDGIDVVIVDINNDSISLIAQSTTPYDLQLKQEIEYFVNSAACCLDDFCQLDRKIAHAYAAAVKNLLNSNNIPSQNVVAIGCHGQTIKHNPNLIDGYTLQIGDPNTLAVESNIDVVADFRRKDVALGGQGAPLAPAFHQFAFQNNDKNRVIVNIGGIANMTVLPKIALQQDIIGFDTGPGNTLLDHLCQNSFNKSYDESGNIARAGRVHKKLVNNIILNEPYFSLPFPKSTGTDYFNLDWFDHFLKQLDAPISAEDQLATLTELTALCISQSIQKLSLKPDEIFYCGGGQLNTFLMQRLQQLTNLNSLSTAQLNIHPDWVEAAAFAWFAKNTLELKNSNIPSVTSASKSAILGGIFKA